MNLSNAVNLAVSIANDNSHGYDQQHRNGPDFDCSSLIAYVLNKSGFPIALDSWTGNLKPQLLACGFKECSKPFKAGDIHLNVEHHVCMSVDSERIVQASINELGTVTGGKTGDQNGNEINIKPYYEYRYGWHYHLRYGGESVIQSLSFETVVKNTLNGVYGNYPERKEAIEKLGFNYQEIQEAVNKALLKSDTGYIDTDINSEIPMKIMDVVENTINGVYGNYPERKTAIEKLGFNYEVIQKLVNERLR